MASPPVNQKTFSLINRISETFSMRLSNFAFATTLLFRIRDKIKIVILPKFSTKMLTTINLRKVKVSIGVVKLITSIIQTINLKKISIVFTMSDRMSFLIDIYGRIRMTISSKAMQKLLSTIVIKKITLSINPVIATFFTLGYFDPEILGDLDTLTLGDMDYS